MSNSSGAKEIAQYKDFTTITNIRKLTQEAINPVVKSIENQLSEILKENQELRRQMTKIDDIFSHQNIITKKIEETNQNLREYKDDQAQKKRDIDKQTNKLSTATENIVLELHTMQQKIESQNQQIDKMNQKNRKNVETVNEVKRRIDGSVEDMQKKYTNFTREVLQFQKKSQMQYDETKSEMCVIREEFRRERNKMEEKTKAVDLYFSERQIVNEKLEDLYGRILKFVTKEDFEGYRKSQAKMIEEKFLEIEKNIEEILPEELKKLLPSIELRLKEVDKIANLEKRIFRLQEEKEVLERRVTKNHVQISNKTVKMESDLCNSLEKIKVNLDNKITDVRETQKAFAKQVSEKMDEMKVELQEEIIDTIERETSEVHRTIQEQIRNKQQTINSERDKKVETELCEVQAIKDKMLSRYNQIEETGRIIDSKIESYSTRITKVRSDYQIFADSIRKEMSGVMKFRASFTDKLSQIGSLMATFAEILLVNGALHVHGSLQETKNKEGVTYVMENDGIVYEWKNNMNGKKSMFYRKHKVELKQFMRSYMYSMVTYFDDCFKNFDFLNWPDHQPSSFFNDRIMDNYLLQVQRVTEAKSFTRPQSHFSNNQNCLLPSSDFQMLHDQSAVEQRGTESTKNFARTIEIKGKGEKALEDIQPIQIRRNYSIKKPKGSFTNSQKSRYDNFLTSRSGQRSRISQMI